MKVFLDDIRNPRDVGLVDTEWVTVRTYDDAETLIRRCHDIITHMSLDHDLGMRIDDGGNEIIIANEIVEKTGYDLLCWMERNDIFWPSKDIYIHSANPVGRAKMKVVVDKWKERKQNERKMPNMPW